MTLYLSHPVEENETLTARRRDFIPWTTTQAHEAITRFKKVVESGQLILLPTTSKVTIQDIRNVVSTGKVFACDFYIQNIEQGVLHPYGVEFSDVVNIDHHSEFSEMHRLISSGNLAINYVLQNGNVDQPVIINHTDCDSIISSLVLSGVIPPDSELFGQAVVAADHTGEENFIADLLQALDFKKDIQLSTISLLKLLCGEELPSEAIDAYKNRLMIRDQVNKLLDNPSSVSRYDNVVLIEPQHRVYSDMFPAKFLEALALIISEPNDKGRYYTRIRLTKRGMEEGLNLLDFKIHEGICPGWAGRWNAGSDRRSDFAHEKLSPQDMAIELNKRIVQLHSNSIL